MKVLGITLIAAGTATAQTGFQLIMEPDLADSKSLWIPVQAAFITAGVALLMFVAIVLLVRVVLWITRGTGFGDVLAVTWKLGVVAVTIPLGYAIPSLALALLSNVPPIILVCAGFILIALGAFTSRGFLSAMGKAAREYWNQLRTPPPANI